MTEGCEAHDTDPAATVEAVFRRIHSERMSGLPICNPALTVRATGFLRWQGDWVGALVLPWAINLLIVPGGGAFRAVSVGQVQRWDFPSGHYDFMGSREAGLGPYQCCSLYSPVGDFDTQADAEAVAQAALTHLLAPPPDARPAPLDRRAFLRTALGRGRS